MDVRRMGTRWRAWAVAAGLGLLLVPAGAQAATVPVITADPAISGTPQVGEELVAAAAWTGDPTPSAAWTWQRCPRAIGNCTAIPRAEGQRYRPVEADINSFLRVQLRVTNTAGSAQARSKPTAAIAPAPPPPPPPPPPIPTATPVPVPTASPPATPGTATPGAAVPVVTPVTVTGRVVSASPAAPLVLDPFPVVRIKGVLTSTGARVTLLTVRAPRGVRIAVDCTGRACPARHYEPPAGKQRLRRFERDLMAGTRLEIRVTKPGYIGKFTAIVIRRDAAPTRRDRCLRPGATRPVKCAAR